jgi:hypothetical protein
LRAEHRIPKLDVVGSNPIARFSLKLLQANDLRIRLVGLITP